VIVAQQILGTQWQPKQWQLPMKEGDKEIALVSLSTRSRQLVTELEPLFSYIFQQPEDRGMYNDRMDLLSF
jgi:hypothetical protein